MKLTTTTIPFVNIFAVVRAKISHPSGKCIRNCTSLYHAAIEVESGLLDETVTKATATFAVIIVTLT